MPTFDFTAPSGKSYSVDGPEGATPEQAFKILQDHIGGDAAKPSVGIGEDLAKVATSAPGRIVGSLAGLPGDLLHMGMQALGDNLSPESNYGSHSIMKSLGSDYQAQTEPGRLAQKGVDFAPALIGGPETLGAKLLTRVAAPAVASEVGGAVGGPVGELAGALAGGVGATAAARKFQAMAAARNASPALTADKVLEVGGKQFDAARDMNLVVTPEFAADAAAKMRADLRGFDPEAQAVVFKAADRLGSLAPAEAIAARSPTVNSPVASSAVNTASQSAPPSLLQFIASKGGLLPDPELEAIGLARGHRAQVPGQSGFFGVVSNKGQKIDRMREAAEEAGYLHGENGATSTPRNFLDAIDAELRGQKRYPAGFEGSRTKLENTLTSEREQHALNRHTQGLEQSLADAGHGQIAPDVKRLAVQMMEREGMDADTAVEHAILQLEHEDSVVSRAAKPAFAPGFPPDMAKGVAMNEVDLIRKQLVNIKRSPDGAIREAARRAISSLQESQLGLTPAQVMNGDPGLYRSAMRDAIGNWAKGKQAQTVLGKIGNAELASSTAGSGANQDNNMRQAMKQLARNANNTNLPIWKKLGFSDQAGSAINQAARGTTFGNVMRGIGKGAPTGLVSAAGGLGIGHMAGGPVGAVALPAVGYIAKKIGDLSTKRAANAITSLILSESPLAAHVAAQLPPQILQQLPSKAQQVLQKLILADPTLSQQASSPVSQPYAQ